MKIDRIRPTPGPLLEFFEQGLSALGAVCERTWHDRLHVLAEGLGARLWNETGGLHEIELHFRAPEESGMRDAQREVFPGCPLTFALAAALSPRPPLLERVAIAVDGPASRAPDPTVAEKLWRAQYPETGRWRQITPLTPTVHFSLVALVRCEVQAIDQQWSLHRMAWSLPSGECDDGLPHALSFARVDPSLRVEAWPTVEPGVCARWLTATMERELASELAGIRQRQDNHLRRELARIDDYFANYERELSGRAARSGAGRLKAEERVAAARAECERHRADQAQRHEIVIVPHVDACLLVAEPAWRATLQLDRAQHGRTELQASFVGRSRRWVLPSREERA